MFKTRTVRFCLVLLTASLILTACGPSEEQLRARDEARAAALAAEARVQSLMTEFETLTNEIPEKEALIVQLEAELAELQAEYEALGGGSR
jgi:predicted RNase H-like nuclease (RuvC/YqgF family)